MTLDHPIEGATASEEQVFAHDFTGVSGAALRLARRLGWTPDDALDIVQDAALEAWRYRYTRRGPFQGWFLAIVYHQAVRPRRRWLTVPLFWRAREAEWSPDSGAPDEELANQLAALPKRQRIALWLHLGLDLPLSEVGRVMGITERAAIQLTWRARQTLRTRMTSGGAEQ
jgi:RNA polymerase sigma factor (sigma-70 family)